MADFDIPRGGWLLKGAILEWLGRVRHGVIIAVVLVAGTSWMRRDRRVAPHLA